MYYYWSEKGIRPSVIYNMPKGERVVVTAFFLKEMEDKRKKRDAF
jgi:hypothetical protein